MNYFSRELLNCIYKENFKEKTFLKGLDTFLYYVVKPNGMG
jgi:hypothetical protein